MRAEELAKKLNQALDAGVEGIEQLATICVPSSEEAIDHMNAFKADGLTFISVLSLLNMAVDEGEMVYMTTESGKVRFDSLEVLRNDGQTKKHHST